uniref:non-reducing end alpha-L-arabinofuranosidase n=1 Tax=Chrysotila carterae TaxID=13221 RepID=A0A7S4FBN4_CHRCT
MPVMTPQLDATLRVINAPQAAISPLMYSMFLETEINFGGEGGLLAELIQNRDFEALGRGRILMEGGQFGAEFGAMTPLKRSTEGQPENYESDLEHLHAPVATVQTPESDASLLRFRDLHSNNPNKQSARKDPSEPLPIYSDFRPWIALRNTSAKIDNSTAPFPSNPHTLYIQGDAFGGVANPGWLGQGISVRKGIPFKGSMYLRTLDRGHLLLSVRLCEQVAGKRSPGVALVQATISVSTRSSDWQLIQFDLPAADRSQPKARLELLLLQPCHVWLDGVSLMPTDAVAGLFRRDIFEAMSRMRPGFVRMPGGNYLEGTGMRTRWDWKATVGLPASRPGHYNSAWGYWTTDALGLYELLLLAEALRSEPQLSVYTGYSIGAKYVPLNDSARFVTDAVDLLDFANAPHNTSPWGRMRAQMGHAAPFGLKRLEVGNEESDMSADGYPAHYKLISDALRAHDPTLTLVASGDWGRPLRGSPCLTGQRCDVWDAHHYDSPDGMVTYARSYDGYNRSLPPVYVGEYAACHGAPSLRAAVAEAALLISLERNADVVVASSFAPLLNNVHGTQWSYNLLNFDSSRLYALPSYYVQLLFAESLGAFTLPAELDPKTDASAKVFVTASIGRQTGPHASWPSGVKVHTPADAEDAMSVDPQSSASVLTIKVANYKPARCSLQVRLDGFQFAEEPQLNATVLTAPSPDESNSLDEPNRVQPEALEVQWSPLEKNLVVLLPAWSVVVVQCFLR